MYIFLQEINIQTVNKGDASFKMFDPCPLKGTYYQPEVSGIKYFRTVLKASIPGCRRFRRSPK